jgi:hypothetical protein
VGVCLEVAAWSVFALQHANADGKLWAQIHLVGNRSRTEVLEIPWDVLPFRRVRARYSFAF